MVETRIGDRVSFRGETFVVLGVSPASVTSRVVLLENAETGYRVEASIEEIQSVDEPL